MNTLNLDPNKQPSLFNLLTLRYVIDESTTVLDEDSNTEINLYSLLEEAAKELNL